MSEQEKKKLSLSVASKASTRIDSGQIRQSFAHGKSKIVAVEVKKKRLIEKPSQVIKHENVVDKSEKLQMVSIEESKEDIKSDKVYLQEENTVNNVSEIKTSDSVSGSTDTCLEVSDVQSATEEHKAVSEGSSNVEDVVDAIVTADINVSEQIDIVEPVNKALHLNSQEKIETKGVSSKSKFVESRREREISISKSSNFSGSGRHEKARGGKLTLCPEEVEKRIRLIKDSMKETQAQVERRKLDELRKNQEIERIREQEELLAKKKIEEEAKKVSQDNPPLDELPIADVVVKKYNDHEKKHDKETDIKYRRLDNDDTDDNQLSARGNVAKKVVGIKKDIKELRGKFVSKSSRISIHNVLDEEEREKTRSLASLRRAKEKGKSKLISDDSQKVVKDVIIPETISVQELANRMAKRATDVVKSLMRLGIMATVNQILDADTAEIVATEFGSRVKRITDYDLEIGVKVSEDSIESMTVRPPVVTIMGHVDHGKTSLLDALRKTDVALGEAGGITQHIGAYQVTIEDGRKITFIDTPGHAAFTEMRSRGAHVTDVVVLVVAADDSVKEQTIEAINHAKAANVPIVVAINKIDKPGANPDKVRSDLLNYDVVVESFGGDVMDVEVSAKGNLNLKKLEEVILLQAEMQALKANPNRNGLGVIIETRVERGLGPVATVLIKTGTLKIGDSFVAGCVHGKVRAIRNDLGENIDFLMPSGPGEIIGFDSICLPGDDFFVVDSESQAAEIANIRNTKQREKSWVISGNNSVEQMFSKLSDDKKELNVVIKGDTQGSIEAICSSLAKISTDEVSVKVLHSGVGGISESDAILAKASNAIILAFNVRPNANARTLISHDKVDVRYYSIIYDLVDDIKSLMSGLLSPKLEEKITGYAQVRQVFNVSKIGRIAGCMVTEGLIKRSSKIRVLRDNNVIFSGTIRSLKRHKDEAKEVRNGFECGILVQDYNDININDIIECYDIQETVREL